MANKILYKYRSLANLQFTLDILINKQLWAADFKKLNDPMEGAFTYFLNDYDAREIDTISNGKDSLGILSLSEIPNNTLMWTHYADDHSGIVLGVEVVGKFKPQEIDYDDDFRLQRNHNAQDILSRKHKNWIYEREHRVFVPKKPDEKGTFVKIRIRELFFGIKSDADENKVMKEVITKIAGKFNPKIEIKDIKKEDLDTHPFCN